MRPTVKSLEELAREGASGDRDAVDALVRAVADDVYGLAVRMLWHPADAEDATQEILVKLVTHLGAFRGESRFATWAFRIAVNHLLTTRRSRAERQRMTFEEFARDLATGLSDGAPAPGADEELLAQEVKIGCTQAMLLCLDRDQRIAYVLGEVFALSSDEAAEVLDVDAATYRKRLSRARERVRTFMDESCGLANPARACRCERRVDTAVRAGRVAPDRLLFAGHPTRASPALLRRGVEEMEELHRTAEIFRSHPEYAAPGEMVERVRAVLRSGTSLLDG